MLDSLTCYVCQALALLVSQRLQRPVHILWQAYLRQLAGLTLGHKAKGVLSNGIETNTGTEVA